MDQRPSISSGLFAVSSTEDLFVALFSCVLDRAARSPRARWCFDRETSTVPREPPARSEPALGHPDVRTPCLLTSGGRADSGELVGDASSKCKEAGGAQDRIIHNDGGSCCGICADGDAGLGRKSLESRTSAITKAHMVAAVCIVVVVVTGGGGVSRK